MPLSVPYSKPNIYTIWKIIIQTVFQNKFKTPTIIKYVLAKKN